jgi:hypothetical protein
MRRAQNLCFDGHTVGKRVKYQGVRRARKFGVPPSPIHERRGFPNECIIRDVGKRKRTMAS